MCQGQCPLNGDTKPLIATITKVLENYAEKEVNLGSSSAREVVAISIIKEIINLAKGRSSSEPTI